MAPLAELFKEMESQWGGDLNRELSEVGIGASEMGGLLIVIFDKVVEDWHDDPSSLSGEDIRDAIFHATCMALLVGIAFARRKRAS